MALETTWHTASGWLVVNDFFVVRPVADQGRRAGYERVPRVGAGVGTILRTATCISGRVEVAATRAPPGLTRSRYSNRSDSSPGGPASNSPAPAAVKAPRRPPRRSGSRRVSLKSCGSLPPAGATAR
jgi:hypothetical protein